MIVVFNNNILLYLYILILAIMILFLFWVAQRKGYNECSYKYNVNFFCRSLKKKIMVMKKDDISRWKSHQDITVISRKTLRQMFPTIQFHLWISHYVFVFFQEKKYVCIEFDNPGFQINESYVPFWFDYIHPWMMSRLPQMKQYFFVMQTWDGSTVDCPFNLYPYSQLQIFSSYDKYKREKEKKPYLFPFFHSLKKIGCFCIQKNELDSLCILDPVFVHTRGYASLKLKIDEYIEKAPHMKNKINKIIFRGSLENGSRYNFFQYEDKIYGPRKTLYLQKEDWQDILDIDDSFLSMEKMMDYKFILDIDGWTNGWESFFWKLYSGCVVFKQESIWKQWYYDEIKPFVHFIPIKNDFSDLREKYKWCMQNESECEKIVMNARRFISTFLSFSNSVNFMRNYLYVHYFQLFAS